MAIRGLLIAAFGLMLAAPAYAQESNAAPMEAAFEGITVDAGETLIFRVVDGQPVLVRKGADGEKPGAGELSVSLDLDNGSTMVVINNSETWYNYRAFITTKPGTKGNRTSVCTLMGGGRMAFENWPEPVPAIRIADFTEADGNMMQCR